MALWIGDNHLSGSGTAFGNALKQNRGLTSLDIGKNSLGPKGAAAFGEALAGNRTLRSLDIG